MLPERLQWIVEAFEPEGDPWLLAQVARDLEAEGNLEGAATVWGNDAVSQAEQIIDNVAHPSARDELREQGRELGLPLA